MVHVIKAHLEDPKNGDQIRRLAVNSNVASEFKLLKDKIRSLFELEDYNFEMKWKDSDNDFILMSSDGELAQALANAEDGLLRVYLTIKDKASTKRKTPELPRKMMVQHPLVTCDGCEKDIFGDRYKCLQCPNFDLCSHCNAAGKHPDHDFIKLVKPANVPREWIFCGARKMWKSMFSPAYMMRCPNDNAESKSSTPSPNRETPRRHCNNHQRLPDMFSNIMNGDMAEAQKLFTEAIGTFTNLLPGGIEVKVEQKPFRAECKTKPCSKQAKAKHESAETCTHNKQEEKVSKPEDKAAEPKKVETPAAPETVETAAEPIKEATEPKKVETATLFPPNLETAGGLFSVETKVKDQVVDTSPVAKAVVDKVPAAESVEKVESKEKSPLADADSSTCAEGWTFIHEDETKKEDPCCGADAVPNTFVEATTTQYPKLEEIKSKLEEGNVIQTSDPRIINALIKMQAMGFTNEGGWLERLLITKKGNINEALDALYPFGQRQ